MALKMSAIRKMDLGGAVARKSGWEAWDAARAKKETEAANDRYTHHEAMGYHKSMSEKTSGDESEAHHDAYLDHMAAYDTHIGKGAVVGTKDNLAELDKIASDASKDANKFTDDRVSGDKTEVTADSVRSEMTVHNPKSPGFYNISHGGNSVGYTAKDSLGKWHGVHAATGEEHVADTQEESVKGVAASHAGFLNGAKKADLSEEDLEKAGKVNPQQAEKKKKADGTDEDDLDPKNKLQKPTDFTDMMRRNNPTVGLQKPVPMSGGVEFSTAT